MRPPVLQAMADHEAAPRSMALLSAAYILCAQKRYASAKLLIEAAFPFPVSQRARLGLMVDSAMAARSWYFADLVLELLARQDRTEVDRPWWREARRRCDSTQPLSAASLRFLMDLAEWQAPPSGTAVGRDGPLVYLMHMGLPQNTTGYAMRSQRFLKALIGAGVAVHAVTRPGFPVDMGQDEVQILHRIDGITYHRVLSPSRSEARKRAYPVLATEALLDHLRDLRPWAIMAASNHVNAVPGLLAARQMGIPFFYDVRGFWELSRLAYDPGYAESPRYREDRTFEQIVATSADAVFTLNGSMQAELVARGVAADRITLLPNAADPEELVPQAVDAEMIRKRGRAWGLPDDVPVIGYIGSFSHYEGLDDLLRAAAILKQRGHDFRLLLIGEELPHLKGQIIPDLQDLARAEGIEDCLIMPGPVPREEVALCYGVIDIAPIPRRNTAVTALVSPLKPLEAMAMGKAVLVSDLPPLAELIRAGETGMIFAAGQIGDLVGQLERLLNDPALRKQLGSAARDWVLRQRTWASIGAVACDRLAELRPSG